MWIYSSSSFIRSILYNFNFLMTTLENISRVATSRWLDFKTSLRAFTLRVLKILAYSIKKTNFIAFNTSLYNTSNIKTSIFLTLHLNIISLLFFIYFLFFLSLPLSQPNSSKHRHPSQYQQPPQPIATMPKTQTLPTTTMPPPPTNPTTHQKPTTHTTTTKSLPPMP